MDIENLVEFIWSKEYLSDTQKNLLENDVKLYHDNLLEEVEAKNIDKDLRIQGLQREIEELEEKIEGLVEIEELKEIVENVIKKVFGLQMKDLVPNDKLKIDKIIKEVK